ncbi:hypothetical protein L1887_00052 [Cichorium endivia]|nr:hypothetical protein L1887_00052 [Cichorium endivia]
MIAWMHLCYKCLFYSCNFRPPMTIITSSTCFLAGYLIPKIIGYSTIHNEEERTSCSRRPTVVMATMAWLP